MERRVGVAIGGKISAGVFLKGVTSSHRLASTCKFAWTFFVAGQCSDCRHPIGADGAEVLNWQKACGFPVFIIRD